MNKSIIAMLKTEKKLKRNHGNTMFSLSKALYHRLCTIFYFVWGKRKLLIDLILEPANKATQQTDDCRNQMSQAYKIASTNSFCRKRKDIARHDGKVPLSAVLEKGDWVLITNSSEGSGTEKMRLSRKTMCLWS